MKKKVLLLILIIVIVIMGLIVAKVIIDKKQSYPKSDFTLDNDNMYKITTSAKWVTMQNDGGSHTNIYYQIDFNENKVTKCEDKYVGFEGYEYQGKVLYSKEISEKEKQELKSILENISNNSEEEFEVMNFNFYILSSSNNEDISIYDKDIINSLQELLEE